MKKFFSAVFIFVFCFKLFALEEYSIKANEIFNDTMVLTQNTFIIGKDVRQDIKEKYNIKIEEEQLSYLNVNDTSLMIKGFIVFLEPAKFVILELNTKILFSNDKAAEGYKNKYLNEFLKYILLKDNDIKKYENLFLFNYTHSLENGKIKRKEKFDFILGQNAYTVIYGYASLDDIYLKLLDFIKKEVSKKINLYDPNSEINYINENAFEEQVKVDDDMMLCLSKAKKLNKVTNKVFDITIYPILSEFGFYKNKFKLPDFFELDKIKKTNVGMDKIYIDEKKNIIKFKRKDVKIDLNGIANGFAFYKIKKFLEKYKNITGMKMNINNDYFFYKDIPDVIKKVEIFSLDNNRKILKTIYPDKEFLFVSTPGIKMKKINNSIFSDKINPVKSNYELDNIVSAVEGDSPIFCDGLATGLLLGGNEVMHIIQNNYHDIKAMVIDKNKKINYIGFKF